MASDKLRREQAVLRAMITLHCHGSAHAKPVCLDCLELMDYAQERLINCPFGDDKPICSKCSVHCYQPAKRAKIREVMRYSGPRMIFCHPMAALRHFLSR